MSIEPGVLYVVATPIGNLNDISLRALQTLRDVDWVAAEDTRQTGRLLQYFGIKSRLVSFNDHNEQSRIPQVLADLQLGKSIALVSDAGTPLISDPGFHLLSRIRMLGLKATPVPGPSSLIAALSVAGLPTDSFVFEGFLPAKVAARRNRLEALKQEERTLAFFEASHRIQASLADMSHVFGGDRQAVVARELTKLFEEVRNDSLEGLCDWIAADGKRRKGEFVVLVHGAPKQVELESFAVEVDTLLAVLLEELPVKPAIAVAAKITGMRKNTLYNLALTLKG